ncbi:hypothetical protein [Bradyrhizobium sp. CCBAU 11386]
MRARDEDDAAGADRPDLLGKLEAVAIAQLRVEEAPRPALRAHSQDIAKR